MPIVPMRPDTTLVLGLILGLSAPGEMKWTDPLQVVRLQDWQKDINNQSLVSSLTIKSVHMLCAGFLKVRDRAGQGDFWNCPYGEASFAGGSADRNCPSALFAGVLNDYIISFVCSTLLFYGGFSIAGKKRRRRKKEKET